eukprot:1377909-Rhodomonas_salina.1
MEKEKEKVKKVNPCCSPYLRTSRFFHCIFSCLLVPPGRVKCWHMFLTVGCNFCPVPSPSPSPPALPPQAMQAGKTEIAQIHASNAIMHKSTAINMLKMSSRVVRSNRQRSSRALRCGSACWIRVCWLRLTLQHSLSACLCRVGAGDWTLAGRTDAVAAKLGAAVKMQKVTASMGQ